MNTEHETNIGRIVIALFREKPLDCTVNHPVGNTARFGSAWELLQDLAEMSEDDAAGICRQL